MAYDHGKQQIEMSATNGIQYKQSSATTATIQFRWSPISNIKIHGWGVLGTVTKAGSPRWSLRYVTGGGASVSGKQISAITHVNVRGKLTVRKGLATTISAGSTVVAICTTAATGVITKTLLDVERLPFNYPNQTQVSLVTT